MNFVKTFGFIILSIIFTNDLWSQTANLNEVRNLFQKAANDEKACFDLIDLLEPVNDKNHLLYGYKGANLMMSANYVLNPFSKLSRFNDGKEMLNTALLVAGDNVELRFLRFASQKSTPAFLGYNDYLEKDKIFLTNALPNLTDKYLIEQIRAQLN
ncbi:MAG TPA: hypothetical protein VFM72_01905 [Aequorivita sp.]|nr:hypothetical protein [Aequorivita sp.]